VPGVARYAPRTSASRDLVRSLSRSVRIELLSRDVRMHSSLLRALDRVVMVAASSRPSEVRGRLARVLRP
jgi:hypothetical protein